MNIYTPQRDFSVKAITSAFRRFFTEYFYFPGEAHNDWEMVYVEKGPLTVMEDERTYQVSGNQVIFHKPMEFHQFKTESTPDAGIMVLCFIPSGDMIDSLGEGVFDLGHDLKSLLFDVFKDIENAFVHIDSCNLWKRENSDPVQEVLALSKLEAFLLSVLSRATLEKQQPYTRDAENYKRIIRVMQEHIYEKLSAQELAHHCHMSLSNLKKVFKRYTDGGVMDHFNRLKILRAMDLLLEGENAEEVSDKLSFSSPNYFSAVFKRETGIQPSQYRKNPYDNRITLKMP